MKNIVFFVMVVIVSLLCPPGYGLLSDVKAASSSLDGDWSITVKSCVDADTGQTCDTNKFEMTITDGVVYEEGKEIGSVTLRGNKVSFDWDPDYLSIKYEEIFKELGWEVTVESLDMKKYAGKLKKNRMRGKFKGTADIYFSIFETTISYDFKGTFKGKKQR